MYPYQYGYPAVPPQAPQPQPAWRPGAEDRLRAAAVGVLNLSGLGLGYFVARRWVGAALALATTGALLLIVLPASPKTVSVGVIVAYLAALLVFAVHGAVRALWSPPKWPHQAWVAALLAVVLLVVPVGGVVLFDNARANSIQTMLLGRLKQADDIVAAGKAQPFDTAKSTYGTALSGYHDLLVNHRGSRAGKLVPARLEAFYQTVGAPYADGQFCSAIAPLSYLRTVPGQIDKSDLGSLAAWPDDRLATSLLRCGTASLNAQDGTTTATVDFNQLMTTFPNSPQAQQVPSVTAAEVDSVAGGLTGADPCGTVKKLRALGTQIGTLNASDTGIVTALAKAHGTADHDVETGTFTCGKALFKDQDFGTALTTMQSFTTDYPNDPDAALAGKYIIASQIAQKDADAGKQPPTLASGGNVTITIANDSPDAIHVLYTGSATGTIDVAACAKCSVYSSRDLAKQNACTSLVIDYPQGTFNVPAGTIYILEDGKNSTLDPPKVITEQVAGGDSHDFCAYESNVLGSALPPSTPVAPPPVTG